MGKIFWRIAGWFCNCVAAALLAVIIWSIVEDIKRDPPKNPAQPRYDCEDNSDTTKGHYKGVLTHCVPVKITRTM